MDVDLALSTKQHSIIPIAAFTAIGDLAKLRTARNDTRGLCHGFQKVI